jgi:hypothetical protein
MLGRGRGEWWWWWVRKGRFAGGAGLLACQGVDRAPPQNKPPSSINIYSSIEFLERNGFFILMIIEIIFRQRSCLLSRESQPIIHGRSGSASKPACGAVIYITNWTLILPPRPGPPHVQHICHGIHYVNIICRILIGHGAMYRVDCMSDSPSRQDWQMISLGTLES